MPKLSAPSNPSSILEDRLLSFLRSLRSQLAAADISDLRLTIDAEGRVHDGDIAITFIVGYLYSNTRAEGGNLEAAVEEYIRRNGYQKRHAPLCLPSVESLETESLESQAVDEEIPF